jgi:hypothetical protein
MIGSWPGVDWLIIFYPPSFTDLWENGKRSGVKDGVSQEVRSQAAAPLSLLENFSRNPWRDLRKKNALTR